MSIRHRVDWSRYGADAPPTPKNISERTVVQGWAGPDVAEEARQKIGSSFQPMFIAGQTESGAGRSVRHWEIFRKVTGHDPDLTPQPTGNCVAASADDAVEHLQCLEIAMGEREKFNPIYNPYHYGYGRVIIGKNQLSGPGSLNSWQMKALEEGGTIILAAGLPKYNRSNCDAWGYGKAAEGKKFQDFVEQGQDHTVRTTAFVQSWELLRDALFNGYPVTIASNRGYSMQPSGGEKGFHTPSGSWSHQMSVAGYSEEGPERDWWVAIKNQWGNVHGRLVDLQTGDPWPAGMIRVRLVDFVQKHLALRGCEAMSMSGYNGFPELRSKIKHSLSW